MLPIEWTERKKSEGKKWRNDRQLITLFGLGLGQRMTPMDATDLLNMQKTNTKANDGICTYVGEVEVKGEGKEGKKRLESYVQG